MPFMQTLFMLLLLVISPGSSKAEIYKWKDASGAVHFSDNAPVKTPAEKINVRVNTYKSVTYEKAPSTRISGDSKASGKVILYGTSWCGYCKKAREYFNARNIRYVDYDIEHDSTARARFEAFGGRGVPVIFIGNTRMNGFNPGSFEKLYKRQ